VLIIYEQCLDKEKKPRNKILFVEYRHKLLFGTSKVRYTLHVLSALEVPCGGRQVFFSSSEINFLKHQIKSAK
jgi:hypothetical protein